MPSIPLLLTFLILFFSSPLVIIAAAVKKPVVHHHRWNITWVLANPDGQHPRRVIGVNGVWPPPVLEVGLGDRLVVDVFNDLGTQDTSIHWHGLFQNGTNHMDGPAQVTQCPIPPGMGFRYDFTVEQAGTYWYHSHSGPQYPDGLRGPLIVNDANDPFRHEYDEQRVLTLSDWYWDEMELLSSFYMSSKNPDGPEPVPNTTLINDGQESFMLVDPGKTYLLRIINMGAFAGQYLWFENHTVTVVEIDGVYTKPQETTMLYFSAAQRMSVLLRTKAHTAEAPKNYAFQTSMDMEMFDSVVLPPSTNPNATAWLIYDTAAVLPKPLPLPSFDPIDDFTLTPFDSQPLLPSPDLSIVLNVTMATLSDGATHSFFSGVTYIPQLVPALFTAVTTGNQSTNPIVYGVNSAPYVLPHLGVVEIILNNFDDGKHPFHLHGHHFQVVTRSLDDEGAYDPNNTPPPPQYPAKRDTVLAPGNGHIVLRFRADNPGVWLFHCHIEWHAVSGLIVTFIVAPEKLDQIPEEQLEICGNIPTAGNAAGNTHDFLDLTGAKLSPPPLKWEGTNPGTIPVTTVTKTKFPKFKFVRTAAWRMWLGIGFVAGVLLLVGVSTAGMKWLRRRREESSSAVLPLLPKDANEYRDGDDSSDHEDV